MTRALPAALGATIEVLTSVKVAGVWHAIYPTAEMTLCGLTVPGFAQGRKWPPTCGTCGRQARRFDQIDRSMPPHWRFAA